MSGLFRRIRLRRAAVSEPEPVAALPAAPAEETPRDPLPADDLSHDQLVGEPPSSRRKGPARRRLRHLGRVRELLLRDLGGFVLELHRVGDDGATPVLDAKLERLAALDAEVRDLEERLDVPRGQVLLREPGIGGACGVCGELFGSEARFCAACGTPIEAAEQARTPAALPPGDTAELPAVVEPESEPAHQRQVLTDRPTDWIPREEPRP